MVVKDRRILFARRSELEPALTFQIVSMGSQKSRLSPGQMGIRRENLRRWESRSGELVVD